MATQASESMGVSTAGCADTCTSRPSWAAICFTAAPASRESALWRAMHVMGSSHTQGQPGSWDPVRSVI